MFWKTMEVPRNYGPIDRMAHEDLHGITNAFIDQIKYPGESITRRIWVAVSQPVWELATAVPYWLHWFRALPERAIEKFLRVFVDRPMERSERREAERLRKKHGG